MRSDAGVACRDEDVARPFSGGQRHERSEHKHDGCGEPAAVPCLQSSTALRGGGARRRTAGAATTDHRPASPVTRRQEFIPRYRDTLASVTLTGPARAGAASPRTGSCVYRVFTLHEQGVDSSGSEVGRQYACARAPRTAVRSGALTVSNQSSTWPQAGFQWFVGPYV